MGDTMPKRRPALRSDQETVEKDENTEKVVSLESTKENCSPNEDNPICFCLIFDIERISIQDNIALDESLETVLLQFTDGRYSPQHMKYALLSVFAKCLEDREFCVKFGALFGLIHPIRVGEETVRSIILQTVQRELIVNDFINGIRPQFLNAVFLLAELYSNVRFDGNPISVLGAELLKYFRWLLTGGDEEIEVLAVGLIVNGLSLKKDKPATFRKIILDVRVALVSRNLSKSSKCWLLLILDHDTTDFKPLSEELLIFYLTLIGDTEFMKLRRWKPSITLSSFLQLHKQHLNKERKMRGVMISTSSSLQSSSETNASLSSDASSSDHWNLAEKVQFYDKRCTSDRQHSSEARYSPERQHSSEARRSPERQNSLDVHQSSEILQCSSEVQNSPERQHSSEHKDSSGRGRSPTRRSSQEKRLSFTSESWDSPEREHASQNDTDSGSTICSSLRQVELSRPQMKTSQRWSMNDHTNAVQRNEGRSQEGQQLQGGGRTQQSLQFHNSQKTTFGRWSAGPPSSGRGGLKKDRKIPVWLEHDDRFDKDYSS